MSWTDPRRRCAAVVIPGVDHAETQVESARLTERGPDLPIRSSGREASILDLAAGRHKLRQRHVQGLR